MADGIVDPFESAPAKQSSAIVDPFDDAARFKLAPEPTVGEKAKATLYGAGTGLLGGLGELEKFGSYTFPGTFGMRSPESIEQDKAKVMGRVGRETYLPTIEDVRGGFKKLGIERPREEVSGYETAGEFLGGFGPSLPSAVRGGVKTFIGTPSKASEMYARKAEDLGFRLSPSQVRQDIPSPSKGATFYEKENQSLANRLSTQGTGRVADEVTPQFIGERLNDLGKKFNAVYEGRSFRIDPEAVDAIRTIANIESDLPMISQVGSVKRTAQEIVQEYDKLARTPGARMDTFAIQGEALQRLRNSLASHARSTSNRGDAREIYNMIDVIDASVAKNHPEVASVLNVIRPQYRNTIILEDLYRKGGIMQGNISLERLGNMLGRQRDVARRTQSDIDALGEIGRELQLRARWESAGKAATSGEDTLRKVFGTGMDFLSTLSGARSGTARNIQRRAGEYAERGPSTIGTGVKLPGERELIVRPSRTAKGIAAGSAAEQLENLVSPNTEERR